MRADIADRNPVQLANAVCGCEVYEVDNPQDASQRQVIAFHDENCKPKPLRKKQGKELVRVIRG